jgi:hypothetical protein
MNAPGEPSGPSDSPRSAFAHISHMAVSPWTDLALPPQRPRTTSREVSRYTDVIFEPLPQNGPAKGFRR